MPPLSLGGGKESVLGEETAVPQAWRQDCVWWMDQQQEGQCHWITVGWRVEGVWGREVRILIIEGL